MSRTVAVLLPTVLLLAAAFGAAARPAGAAQLTRFLFQWGKEPEEEATLFGEDEPPAREGRSIMTDGTQSANADNPNS